MKFKMKKILLFALGITTLLSSCDVLEGPFDEKVTVDTSAGPKRKILLEDFTGHTCGNCPCAAYEALRLDTTAAFRGRIIIVASHVGFFAEPYTNGTKFRTDFRTTAGNEVNDFFHIDDQGLPQGMVNRTVYNSARILSSTTWASAVGVFATDTNISKYPAATLSMSASYNSANRTASVEVNSKYLKEGNSNHQLVVYVVEDSIINWQKFYESCGGIAKDVPDYVHRHVLRGAVNSTWGDALYTTGSVIPIGTSINKSYTQVLDPTWEAKHIYFVAFIQDNVTKEVVQVEEVKLIE
jgi:hypothetical protein